MKRTVAVCLLGIALMAATTPSAKAEPITLTAIAITGLSAVALLGGTDMAVRHSDNKPAPGKSDSVSESQKQSSVVTKIPLEH